MAKSTGTVPPQKLNLPELANIHITHPAIGKTIQQMLEYINKNVNPLQGNKRG